MPLSGQDIFGYRIIFTVPSVFLAIFIFKQKHVLISHLKRIYSQPWFILIYLFNGLLMGFQMWLFLWRPNNGGALSVSLGYLLLPLVMVAFGKIFFKEYISKTKLLAIFIAAVGVVMNIIIKGGLSWESIAVSGYAIYFTIRKHFKMTDIGAFAIEIILILPICIYFATQANITEVRLENHNIVWLLVILGLLSGIAFNAYIIASNLLPVNLLGLLGYVEPIMMLIISLLIGENIDKETYPLFFCLIIAMILIIFDGIKKSKQKKILLKN